MKKVYITEQQLHKIVKNAVLETLSCLGKNYINVRKLAHDIKRGDIEAIEKASLLLAEKCPSQSILIPIPQHTGKADYTLALANRLAKLTNSKVLDIIYSNPRTDTLYSIKKQNHGVIKDYSLGFQIVRRSEIERQLKSARNVILIDNVVDSGMTYTQAFNLVEKNYNVKPWMLCLGAVVKPKDNSMDIIRSVF